MCVSLKLPPVASFTDMEQNQSAKSAKVRCVAVSCTPPKFNQEEWKWCKPFLSWSPLSYPLQVHVLGQRRGVSGLNLRLLRRSSLGSGPTLSPTYSLSGIQHGGAYQKRCNEHGTPNFSHGDSGRFYPSFVSRYLYFAPLIAQTDKGHHHTKMDTRMIHQVKY